MAEHPAPGLDTDVPPVGRAAPIPPVHDNPGHLIRRCQQIAVALFLERCRPFDLTPMQYAVLGVARARPGMDQISLAGVAALDRSNVARLCSALEQRGLLRRTPDPADRRAVLVFLTDQGRMLLDRAEPAVQAVQRDLLSPLAPAERARFLAALRTITGIHNELSRAPWREMAPDEGAA